MKRTLYILFLHLMSIFSYFIHVLAFEMTLQYINQKGKIIFRTSFLGILTCSELMHFI